jgi:DNA ligase-1
MNYGALVKVYHALEQTTKRLEKTDIIARFLQELNEQELSDLISLLQGRVFSEWDERKIGFSSKLMIKAIAQATGSSTIDVELQWSKKGDLGIVAEDLIQKKKQTTLGHRSLTTEKVITNIRKLAELEGQGTVDKKVSLVAELLSMASSEEARFIVRTILEELRVGVAAGILRDAVAQAFQKPIEEVEEAFHLKADYGEVALLAKTNKLKEATLTLGKPIHSMLALLVKDISEAFEALGKPALFEYKLDGFRLQIHKSNNAIKLFTRRLEEVTKQFPDVVETVKQHVKGKEFILDVEAAGYDPKTKKYLPFQNISQRIKRKYNIEEMAKKFPIEVNVFDVLSYEGQTCTSLSQQERRALLEKIISPQPGKLIVTKKLITDSLEEAQHFYKESLKAGNEGVMVKKLDAAYKPGRYVEGWVKLKPTLEPLDLVIVGAEAGTGKRAGMLTSYVVACRSGKEFLPCGMVSTGLKEKEEEGVTFAQLSKMLQPLIIKKEGRSVTIKPKILVEVAYEEIQKSPTYASGYALRFPRIKSLRTLDKDISEANTLHDIEHIYTMQKTQKHKSLNKE